MENLIINLAPTGMIPTSAMTPHVPVTPEAIIADACRCAELGVSIVHLHARDADGRPSHDREIYARIIGGIRERHPELILCVSLSGRDTPEFEKRSEPLSLTGDLRPDMASLTLASLNFAGSASLNAPDMVKRLADAMAVAGIMPELEVFDTGMVNYARYLIDRGHLEGRHYFNLMLGNVASAQATPLHLGTLMAGLPADAIWATGGIGDAHLAAHMMGVLHADGVRVGLEDTIWTDPQRQQLATNAQLVTRVRQLCEMQGRGIATPAEVRQRLGLAA